MSLVSTWLDIIKAFKKALQKMSIFGTLKMDFLTMPSLASKCEHGAKELSHSTTKRNRVGWSWSWMEVIKVEITWYAFLLIAKHKKSKVLFFISHFAFIVVQSKRYSNDRIWVCRYWESWSYRSWMSLQKKLLAIWWSEVPKKSLFRHFWTLEARYHMFMLAIGAPNPVIMTASVEIYRYN